MKKRTIKFLGVLVLGLAGLSAYLFAQNAGGSTVKKGVKYYQDKYCMLDFDDADALDNYDNCMVCMDILYRLNRESDPDRKEAQIDKRVRSANGDFSEMAFLLKKELLAYDPVDTQNFRQAILENIEARQIKRYLGEKGKYTVRSFDNYLEGAFGEYIEGYGWVFNGKVYLTARALTKAMKELHEAAVVYEQSAQKVSDEFLEVDEIYADTKIDQLKNLARKISRGLQKKGQEELAIKRLYVMLGKGMFPADDGMAGVGELRKICSQILMIQE